MVPVPMIVPDIQDTNFINIYQMVNKRILLDVKEKV